MAQEYRRPTDPQGVVRSVNLSEDQPMYCIPHYVDSGMESSLVLLQLKS